MLAVLLGPRLIAWLRRHFREPIKSDSPEVRRLHQGKQATPTMGGLFIIAGLIGGTLLFGDLANRYVLLALWVAGGLTVVGAVDDLVKLRTPGNGLSPGMKLAGQVVVAAGRPRSCSIATMPRWPTDWSCRRRWPAAASPWDSGSFPWPYWSSSAPRTRST